MRVSVVRYWGSYFKRPQVAMGFANSARMLAARDWNVCLVCSQPPEDRGWLRPLLDAGVRIVYQSRPKKGFDWECIRNVYSLCREVRCDLFECVNIHTSPLIGATLSGVPVRIWHKRSMNECYETCRKPTLRDRIVLSVRTSCFLATRTLTVSQAVKDELVDLGIPARKLAVFPNTISRTNVRSLNRKEVRRAFGYEDADIVFTTVGHAVPVKGWDVLLRAFHDVARAAPRAKLLLVGSTRAEDEKPTYEELREFIHKHGLSDKVIFTGRLQDVSEALAASDVFVLPSRSEGFSNALLEAAGAGLPCISTRVGGALETIREGINGLLVSRNDHQELARALVSVARDGELRNRLSEGARNTDHMPTKDEMIEKGLNLYYSLLGRSDRAAME